MGPGFESQRDHLKPQRNLGLFLFVETVARPGRASRLFGGRVLGYGKPARIGEGPTSFKNFDDPRHSGHTTPRTGPKGRLIANMFNLWNNKNKK